MKRPRDKFGTHACVGSLTTDLNMNTKDVLAYSGGTRGALELSFNWFGRGEMIKARNVNTEEHEVLGNVNTQKAPR